MHERPHRSCIDAQALRVETTSTPNCRRLNALAYCAGVWPGGQARCVHEDQHRRYARCAGARLRRDAGTGTFHPGVLMPSRNRIQSLRQQAFNRQGGRCCYCNVRMWLNSPTELTGSKCGAAAGRLRCTAEHLEPQSEGGSDTASNIAAACAHCNHTRHKRKKPPEPAVYREEVRRRVARGEWHVTWVFESGLLPATPPCGPSGGRRPGPPSPQRALAAQPGSP
jgi:5-methylcytosine-specific restriction endonuclease McrA